MTLLLIVYRSLRQHAFSTMITAASLALAGGLLMTVWMVKAQAQNSFLQTTTAFDAVLGARGSKLQLVLNAIFHLEASPGNLAWQDYEAVRRSAAVKVAIPIAVGDNLRGYRIALGTIPGLFTDVEYGPGEDLRGGSGREEIFAADAKRGGRRELRGREAGLLRSATRSTPFHGLAYDPSAQPCRPVHGRRHIENLEHASSTGWCSYRSRGSRP